MRKRKQFLALLLSGAMVVTPLMSASPVYASEAEEIEAEEAIEAEDESVVLTDTQDEVVLEGNEECKTWTVTTETYKVSDPTETSGMYAMENVVVTQQEDGTYLVRAKQKTPNRNLLAFTDSVEDATAHKVDWYDGGSDCTFTFPVASLEKSVVYCMASTDRINSGKSFGNPMYLTFDLSTLTENAEVKPASAEDMVILKAEKEEVLPVELTVTNKTTMFKIGSASIITNEDGSKDVKLVINSTSYSYMLLCEYEDAVAAGDVRDKWIAGDLDTTAKTATFVIPYESFKEKEMTPVTVVSSAKLKNYEAGTLAFDKIFYARMMTLDSENASLETDDYKNAVDLTVEASGIKEEVAFAKLATVGGPTANNYAENLIIKWSDAAGIEKMYLGTSEEAAKGEAIAKAEDGTFTIALRKNKTGGAIDFDYLEKEITMAVCDTEGSWTDFQIQVSKKDGKAVIKKEAEECKTWTITTTTYTLADPTKTSGMYAMQNVVLTKLEDGSYLVRAQQKTPNRNLIAFADNVKDANAHNVDWYDGGKDCIFTFRIASLDENIVYCMASDSRMKEGKGFGSPMILSLDLTTMKEAPEETPAKEEDIVKLDRANFSAVIDALAKVHMPSDTSMYDAVAVEAVNTAVAKVDYTATSAQQAEVDAVAEEIEKAAAGLKKELTVTNKTTMFKIGSAVILPDEKGNNIVKLVINSTSYSYMLLCEYEDAVAAGDVRDKWIAGDLDTTAKTATFVIPYESFKEKEMTPVTVVSSTKLKNYEAGTLAFDRIFYARMMTLDSENASLETDDYKNQKDIAVASKGLVYDIEYAAIGTVGGPTANNYAENLIIKWSDAAGIEKMYLGTTEEAAKGEAIAKAEDGTFTITLRKNAKGGELDYDLLEKEITMAVCDAEGNWTDFRATVSKIDRKISIEKEVVSGPIKVNGEWKLMGEDAKLLEGNGTPVVNGKKYYLDNGNLKTGMLKLKGMQLYFYDAPEFYAATGVTKIDGKAYLFNEDGVEILKSRTEVVDGKKYWFNEDGSLRSGWATLGNWKMYYDPETYAAATGLTTIDGKTYLFNEDGVLKQEYPGLAGPQYEDGEWVLYGEDGEKITKNGTPVVAGNKYYVSKGVLKSGWLKLKNWQMHFDEETFAAAVGITKIEGKAYYFDKNGVEIIKSRTEVIDGKKYWFNEDGSLRSGWVKLGNWTMYFDKETYAAATGKVTIDGKEYTFNDDGVLID